MSLCETSYGLVDVFPVEDRKSALCEVNAFLCFLFLACKYYTHKGFAFLSTLWAG
jgi:hypothetical protein